MKVSRWWTATFTKEKRHEQGHHRRQLEAAQGQGHKLTDDDFDVIAGKRDQLLGRIQERHGISRDEAENQVKAWESAEGRTPAALWYEKY